MLKTLFFSLWFVFHPVHVTLTSIDYMPENDSFKVFVRMYFDDFLLDCKLNGEEIQKNDFSGENSASRNIMERYLKDKVVLKVNDRQLAGKLQDMIMSDNEVSTNLVYSDGKKPRTVTVKNLIMTDLYRDQSNMIIVKVNDFEEGVKLTSDLTEKTFEIK